MLNPVSRRASLDEATLDRLAASVGTGSLVEAMDRVLRSTRTAWQQIRECAATGDLARVAVLARELRADCAHMGASALAQHLGEIEAKAQDPRWMEGAREINAILAEMNCFLEDLRSARARRQHQRA